MKIFKHKSFSHEKDSTEKLFLNYLVVSLVDSVLPCVIHVVKENCVGLGEKIVYCCCIQTF